MRSTLAMALLGACSSPSTDTGSDARTPFIPEGHDDSGSDDSADWSTHRVEPGDANGMPFDPRNQPDLGRPWVDSGAPPVPVFDCSLVPDEPTEINELDAPRGYHDVIFDTDGNLIGSDGSNLRASPDPDTSNIWLPNVGDVQGMDWLPDGDIVAASGSAIVRINAEDGKSVITSGLYGYGVTVGPDGMVYVGGNASVMKLDPETGDFESFVGGFDGATPRVTNFSPDYSKMYIGTLGTGGRVYAVDLDKDLEPIGDPYVFAEDVGGGYHDGMGVDVCGNVYVNDYNTFSLYRVTPAGDVSLLKGWTWSDGGYGHGQDFGSGIGSWRSDAIYVPQPYDGNTVAEVVVEIPGRKYNGGMYEAINVDE
jgi:hypothetical protein